MADVAPAFPRGPRRSTRTRGLPYARPTPRAPVLVDASSGSTRLFISNLHYEVTEQDLRKLFSSIGPLAQAPRIIFDRSGRSTGVAHIVYERHEDALKAKKQFDGQPAKGQTIGIRFEAGPPGPAAAGAGASAGAGGAGKSLLARIGQNPKASLLDRLGAPPAASASKKPVPTAPRAAAAGPGPVRSQKGNRPPRGRKAKPKTQTDLDKELDAYLETESKPQSGEGSKAGDVVMAA